MKKSNIFSLFAYALSLVFTVAMMLFAPPMETEKRLLQDNVECVDEVKTDYCRGWEKGYVAGYCHEVQNCIKPIVPICPIPKIECNRGFKCGYNRGFLNGLADQ